MGKEERSTYTIAKEESVGEVKIADEVVASIAAFATMDVEGVASIGGNEKEKGRLSMKAPSKVKSSIESMTGLKVADVNIRVAGVDVPEEV